MEHTKKYRQMFGHSSHSPLLQNLHRHLEAILYGVSHRRPGDQPSPAEKLIESALWDANPAITYESFGGVKIPESSRFNSPVGLSHFLLSLSILNPAIKK